MKNVSFLVTSVIPQLREGLKWRLTKINTNHIQFTFEVPKCNKETIVMHGHWTSFNIHVSKDRLILTAFPIQNLWLPFNLQKLSCDFPDVSLVWMVSIYNGAQGNPGDDESFAKGQYCIYTERSGSADMDFPEVVSPPFKTPKSSFRVRH